MLRLRRPSTLRIRCNRPRPRPNPRPHRPRPSPRLRTDRNNVPITYTSGDQVEVYRFNWPITLGVPATALFLQAWLPHQFPAFAMLDLPLLVTIFFAISRRNPISGLLTGDGRSSMANAGNWWGSHACRKSAVAGTPS